MNRPDAEENTHKELTQFTNDKVKINLNSVFGAWKDSRDADEIIKEIRESRTFNQDRVEF